MDLEEQRRGKNFRQPSHCPASSCLWTSRDYLLKLGIGEIVNEERDVKKVKSVGPTEDVTRGKVVLEKVFYYRDRNENGGTGCGEEVGVVKVFSWLTCFLGLLS